MNPLQNLCHGCRVAVLGGSQHFSGFNRQTVHVPEVRFLPDHIGKLIHQFLVGNGDIAVVKAQEAIDHHSGVDFVLGFQFGGSRGVFLHIRQNRRARHHGGNVVPDVVNVILDVEIDFVIRSRTRPEAAEMVIGQGSHHRTWIIQPFARSRLIPVIPQFQIAAGNGAILILRLITTVEIVHFFIGKAEILAELLH